MRQWVKKGLGVLILLAGCLKHSPTVWAQTEIPSVVPYDEDLVASDEWREEHGAQECPWVGVYYGEGAGIELLINVLDNFENSSEKIIHGLIQNYNTGSMLWGGYFEENGGILQATDTDITVSRDEENILQIKFGDMFMQSIENEEIYKNQSSVMCTDIRELMAEPEVDYWSGTYEQEQEESTYMLSVIQLYGTKDFAVVRQSVSHGEDEGFYIYDFYTEREDLLIHEYMPGVIYSGTTYGVYSQDEDGDLRSYDSVFGEGDLETLPIGPHIYYYTSSDYAWN